jgi:flagellar basal-body rod protein FlgC
MADFFRSIQIAASGLRAQAGRMRVVAENLANADSGPARAGDAPYRRKIPTFQRQLDREQGVETVRLGRIARDGSAFRMKHEPGHPAADANGFVKMPNVNSLIEQMDLREAQRSYEANVSVIGAARRMIARTLDILRA